MQEVSRNIFLQLTSSFEWVPFSQTLAYNLSMVPEGTLHWYIDDANNPCIGCVGYERRKAGISMLNIAGECLKQIGSVDRKRYAAFYTAVHETGFDIYELNLNTPYTINSEIALRTAGWLRPVGLFSTTLSKIVHTCTPLSFDKSWKHNLKKAHESLLRFEVKEEMDAPSIRDFVAHHRDLQQRKGFRESVTEKGLQALTMDAHFKMGVITDAEGRTLAGCIFYARNHTSVTLYSFSTQEGRERGAAYMLREGIINYLAQQGIDTLDLGRLSPATHEKNNIFLFKDGIGGDYVHYLGEWEYCRRRWMSVMLYFAKMHIWKRVRV